MSSHTDDIVRQHYEAAIADQDALLARLGAVIEAMPRPLSTKSFASFDQFHIGGLAATAELARRVAPTSGMAVLDAGSGLGGPSRYLAESFGCMVTGIDLAPTYVAIAALVAETLGLSDKVRYQAGSIVALPFAASSFDLVWTQHVVMNVADRDSLYREFRRVLKPGGRLAFYDPYAPDSGEPPLYPVPWADTPETSTLLIEADTVAALHRAGLNGTVWDDVTGLGLEWIGAGQQQHDRTQPALGTGMVMGPRMAEMVQNFGRNLRERRVLLAMGTAQAN